MERRRLMTRAGLILAALLACVAVLYLLVFRPGPSSVEGLRSVPSAEPGAGSARLEGVQARAPATAPTGPENEVGVDLEPLEAQWFPVRVRVVAHHPAGPPVPNAKLWVYWAARGSHVRALPHKASGLNGATTGEDGTCRFEIQETHETDVRVLWAEARGFATRTQPLPWPVDADEILVVLVPGRSLTGVVQTADDVPVAGVTVSARRMGYPRSRELERKAAGSWWRAVETDALGRFRLEGLADALYELALDDRDWILWESRRDRDSPPEPQTTLFQAGTGHDIRLRAERLLYFRVRFVEAGSPHGARLAERVFVTGVHPDADWRELDPEHHPPHRFPQTLGRQRFGNGWVGCVAVSGDMLPEEAELSWIIPDTVYAPARVPLLPRGELFRDFHHTEVRVEVRSRPAGSLEVRYEMPEAWAYSRDGLRLRGRKADGTWLSLMGFETSPYVWIYRHVPPGVMTVAPEIAPNLQRRVEVRDGETTRLDVDLKRLSGITVEVFDEEGQRLFDTHLYVTDIESGQSLPCHFLTACEYVRHEDRTDRPWLRPLPLEPGRYEVSAHLPGHLPARKTVTVHPRALTSVMLTLRTR